MSKPSLNHNRCIVSPLHCQVLLQLLSRTCCFATCQVSCFPHPLDAKFQRGSSCAHTFNRVSRNDCFCGNAVLNLTLCLFLIDEHQVSHWDSLVSKPKQLVCALLQIGVLCLVSISGCQWTFSRRCLLLFDRTWNCLRSFTLNLDAYWWITLCPESYRFHWLISLQL